VGATNGRLGGGHLASTNADFTLDRLPLARAEEGVACTRTKGLEGKVPIDAGAPGMSEVMLGGSEPAFRSLDPTTSLGNQVLVPLRASAAIGEVVQHALGVLDIGVHVLDGGIGGLDASAPGGLRIHLELRPNRIGGSCKGSLGNEGLLGGF